MVKIEGLYNTAFCYTPVLEDAARAQIQSVCDQKEFAGCKIRVMPDVHAGKGCTIGTTMTIRDKIVPGMVGVDIGCGMETVELSEREIDFERLDALIRKEIPYGREVRDEIHALNAELDLSQLCCADQVNLNRAMRSIGSLGGGNHFIEVDRAEDGRLFLVVHSGSRHLGTEVANFYQDEGRRALWGGAHYQIKATIDQMKAEGRFKEIQKTITALKREHDLSIPKDLAYVEGALFDDYIHDMKLTQKFAILNRKAMVDVILSGMGLTPVDEFIIKSYGETKALSDLMIYLAPFGVSMKKVAMIREEFGDNSLRIVKTDPFQLCKIKGFGFMTVDSIARKTKVSLKHPLRYSGAINYVLDEARISGHLFLSVDETVGQCYELLNMGCDDEVVSEEEIRQAISNERVESRIYVEGSRVYLSYERMCEVKSAKRIVSMILQEGFTKIDDLDSKIDNAERTLHQRLAPSQRNAVKLCLSHPISIMTGGPGSGKTTTLRFILDIYKAAFPANEVLLAAPTGRASRRMAEQTGMHASTLHSALGLVTDEDSPLNDKELLSADLVVVDEFSMVDMRLAYILLDRIKSGAQLIIVGDADQLPSVGAGNVLREMIRSDKVPTAVLETVFRQASNSRIITNAYAINHNDTHLQFGDDFQFLEVQNSEEAAQLVIKNYLQEVSLHGIEDVQILSPLRKRGAVAANALNETIRDLVNPPNNLKKEVKCGSRVFRVGDRIMQTANRINVSNGDVGIITDMKKEDDETITCVRLLDGRTLQYTQEMLEDLEFSYCTTIHKSQGQEYPVIIVPLLKEHYIMLRRNLLYTAVTRAKAKVILIGQKQAVFVAIHKCDVGQRNTVLADRIVAYYNRELSRRVA